jgi:hypothetical protein
LPEAVGPSISKGFQQLKTQVNAKAFFLRTGFRFRDRWTWWNPKTRLDAHGEPFHSGMDFVVFEGADGQVHGMNHREVPVMAAGKVHWIYDDLMQRTVVVETVSNDTPVYTVYMHIRPREGLRVGDSLPAGEMLGTIVPSKNQKSIIAPHLHFGVCVIPDEPDRRADTMTDDRMNLWIKQGQAIFVDPLDLIPNEQRREMFIEGTHLTLPGAGEVVTADPAQADAKKSENPFDIVLVGRAEDWEIQSGDLAIPHESLEVSPETVPLMTDDKLESFYRQSGPPPAKNLARFRFIGTVGVGRADWDSTPPPSEPDWRISRIRLSS